MAQRRLKFIKLLITPIQPELTSSRGDLLQQIRTYGAHGDLALVVGASHGLVKGGVVVRVIGRTVGRGDVLHGPLHESAFSQGFQSTLKSTIHKI